MDLYTRARKHIDMSRVKEIHTKNIEEQKIAKIKFQEEKILLEKKKIEILEDPRYSNWKSELVEGTPVPIEESMTTTAIFSMHLEPSDQVLTQIPSTTISSADNIGSPTDQGVVPRVQSFEIVDASKTDTITLNISGSFVTKTIDDSTISDKVSVGVLVGGTYGGNYLAGGNVNAELGNGTHTITIPQKFRKAGVKFDVIQITAFDGGEGAQSSSVSVTGVGLKRLNRMTAFVSLDDPEATAFIRSTLANENLSPEQKKKKLEEMLGASAEYLTKMFGEGIFTGATEISDVEIQQSFAQMAANQVDYGTDLTPLSDNPYGTEIAQVASVDLMNLGIDATTATVGAIATALGIGYNAAVDLKNSIMQMRGGYPDYGADAGPTTTGQSLPGVGENTPAQQAEIDDANQEISDARQALNDAEDSGNQTAIDMARERLNRANNNRTRLRQRNRNQRNLPGYQGESVIHEKKKLKSPESLLDKIPGYYDGKPAPLGFPIEEPPKIVNGKHPDLVDGKKVSQRYNRLDPISAKAMPKTGNKHIDSKVVKARSKAK